MNAGKPGVKHGSEVNLSSLFETGVKALAALRDKDREPLVPELAKALAAFKDGQDFRVELLKPKNLLEFLALASPMPAVFNQFASETDFSVLLDQIEGACMGDNETLQSVRPFIAELWAGEVAENPFKPPKDWRYLLVPEAVEAYRKIFGSSLRADTLLKLAREVNPAKDSEGAAVWIKLTTLAKLFGVKGNPLHNDEKGREAYARIVELFVPQVGEAYRKTYPQFGFKNWREGQLTSGHIILTPAGLATWRELESESDDDFVIAAGGASTGSWYAGSSLRRSRLGIVLSGDHRPQDCIMTGGTIAIQPDRLTRFEDLGMDCPGDAFSPDADGKFSSCVCWGWGELRLHFVFCWFDGPDQSFGAAAFRRP